MRRSDWQPDGLFPVTGVGSAGSQGFLSGKYAYFIGFSTLYEIDLQAWKVTQTLSSGNWAYSTMTRDEKHHQIFAGALSLGRAPEIRSFTINY